MTKKQQTSLSFFFGGKAATTSSSATSSTGSRKKLNGSSSKLEKRKIDNEHDIQNIETNDSDVGMNESTATCSIVLDNHDNYDKEDDNTKIRSRSSRKSACSDKRHTSDSKEEIVDDSCTAAVISPLAATSKSNKYKSKQVKKDEKDGTNDKEKESNDEDGPKQKKIKKSKFVIEDDDDDDDDLHETIDIDMDVDVDVDVDIDIMKDENYIDKHDHDNHSHNDCQHDDDMDKDVPLSALKPNLTKTRNITKSTKTTNTSNHSESSKNNNGKNNAFLILTKSSSKSSSSPSSKTTSNNKNGTINSEIIAENKPIPYSTLTETLSSIEAITSRLEIQNLLTKLFSQCIQTYPQDLITLVYLSSNSVAPAYQCVELGIGDAILIKAVAEASGSTPAMVKQKYEADGDLGTVAVTAKGKQRTLGFGIKPKPLNAHEVLQVYRQIASISGSQSQKLKVDMIKGLLVRATQKGNESKYIIRGLQGKLRIGLAQSTVLISLAHAALLSCPLNQKSSDKNDNNDDDYSTDCHIVKNHKSTKEARLESAVNIVKKAYSEVSSFDALVEALISTPLWDLHKSCSLRPGFPVTPMLAKPTKSIQEVLKRLSGKRFTCEYKYDGERAQVHMQDDGVTKVFSRSLLDTSEKFPEVPKYVKEACSDNVKSFILDTEVVAYNRETKQFVPFQVLSTRKKTEESDDNAKVKVIVQAFDLMYLNGESLLDHTLSERRDLLLKNFNVVDGKFQFATSLDHKEDGDTTLIEDFLDAAVKGQCEGLMVKTLDENASYQPSYRSLNWLKLKKDYLEGMGDSVDLVPIGAYHGRGKRTGVYGAYLLACYDLDTEEFQSVCKIGTGFSDDDLKTLSSGLKDKIIKEKSSQYNVSTSLECDVWFEACQVWEVKAADLSKSSTHRGAIDKTGESGRGIGLRFPRFERLRDDKKPENATTSDQILEMYYAQDSVVDVTGGDFGDDGI